MIWEWAIVMIDVEFVVWFRVYFEQQERRKLEEEEYNNFEEKSLYPTDDNNEN